MYGDRDLLYKFQIPLNDQVDPFWKKTREKPHIEHNQHHRPGKIQASRWAQSSDYLVRSELEHPDRARCTWQTLGSPT